MIKIENFTVSKKNKEILKIKEFDSGEVRRIGIFGKNGAGKTTLIKTLLRMERYEGVIQFTKPYHNLQVLMQQNGYSPYAKVKDILQLVLNIKSLEPIMYFIQYISFEDCLDKYVGVLSGGEMQKMNLTLILMSKPDLMIVDEITTGLDAETRQKIQKYIAKYIEDTGCHLIMVSHYKEELAALTEKVIDLQAGKIKQLYEAKEFLRTEEERNVANDSITEITFN